MLFATSEKKDKKQKKDKNEKEKAEKSKPKEEPNEEAKNGGEAPAQAEEVYDCNAVARDGQEFLDASRPEALDNKAGETEPETARLRTRARRAASRLFRTRVMRFPSGIRRMQLRRQWRPPPMRQSPRR